MNVTYLTAELIDDKLVSCIEDVDTIVDVGPGIRPQSVIQPRVHICIEPYKPYIDKMMEQEGGTAYIFLNSTWDVVLPLMADKSIDSLFALDVIEHMTADEGQRLLAEAERICRTQIVIFTPLGYYPQSYEPGELDRWGMGGGHWQTHRSGWTPEDFGPGWDFLVCNDFHTHDPTLSEPMGAFLAIRNLSRTGSKGRWKHQSKNALRLLAGCRRLIKRALIGSTPKPVSDALRTILRKLRQLWARLTGW